jgi:hypothetical protein
MELHESKAQFEYGLCTKARIGLIILQRIQANDVLPKGNYKKS